MSARETREQILKAGFEIVERNLLGLYLPIVAEIFGNAAVSRESYLEEKIREDAFKALLWTHGYVLRAS